MKGRTEDKIRVEQKLLEKISEYPGYLKRYFFYLNEKTYMTKQIYIDNAIRFIKFIGNGIPANEDLLSKIDGTIVQMYINSIQYVNETKEMKGSSKSNIESAINCFLTFLVKQHILKENPFDNGEIQRPRIYDNDIIYLEPEEFQHVKSNIMSGVGSNKAKEKKKDYKYRDLLLVQIPVITGIRVTALSQLSFSDIDFENGTIKIIDKNKPRLLYVDDETIGLIRVWQEIRNGIMSERKCQDKGYVFISSQKNKDKMEVRSIRYVIEKYTKDLDKHISPHKLRHTFGTNLYKETGDILLVSKMMGHNSPETTKKYTKVDECDKLKAMKLLANRMNQ